MIGEIVYCPLHARAARLRDALEESYCFACDSKIGLLENKGCSACEDFKALLRECRGKEPQ